MIKIKKSDIVMATLLMLILAVMFVPIPPMLLDLLLVLNIAVAVLMLVFIISIKDPLEFSSFPTVLLMVTLMRLAVNVSSTRQILLNAFAGDVIEAFGDFVVGGNYLVGLVIFGILVIINFKVITKGSSRVAEVAARFTLDAMPGKQMSIDADLNQGIITEKQAMARRAKLVAETDFYGSMDGASKFVSGDATAGLIIIALNILAGFVVGMTQKGMGASEALTRYTILTIGDGLVSQIPALIISTGAGVLVTRATSNGDLGTELGQQLLFRPRPMMITGSMMIAAGLVPGLPTLPFLSLGITALVFGYVIRNHVPSDDEDASAPASTMKKALESGAAGGASGQQRLPAKPPEPTAKAYKDILSLSALELQIGFGLISLVDREQGGRLVERISNVRTQIAEEMGFVMPPVNVHDNMALRSNDYRILIRGIEVARYSVIPGFLLAIDPSGELAMDGVQQTVDPSFGFKAYWVSESRRSSVEARGFTVVDPSGVITTHIATLVKQSAHELLARQDVSELIEQVKEAHSAVVEELIPKKLEVGAIHRVLQELLKEQVSIRDLPTILETLADHSTQTKDTGLLNELCRHSIGGTITQPYLMHDGSLKAIGLHPDLEELLKSSGIAMGATTSLRMDPVVAREVLDSIAVAVDHARMAGAEPVMLASPAVRRLLRQLVQCEMKNLPVLSLSEVPARVNVDIVNMIPAPTHTRQMARV